MKQERMVKKAALFVWALILLIIRAPSSVPPPLFPEHIFSSRSDDSRILVYGRPPGTAFSGAGLKSKTAVIFSCGQYCHPLLSRTGLWQGSLEEGCAP